MKEECNGPIYTPKMRAFIHGQRKSEIIQHIADGHINGSFLNVPTGMSETNPIGKNVYKHSDKPGEGAKKRLHLKGQDKVHAVMGEFKRGTLRSGGSGKHVSNRKQAIAIAMSEAGKSRKK